MNTAISLATLFAAESESKAATDSAWPLKASSDSAPWMAGPTPLMRGVVGADDRFGGGVGVSPVIALATGRS
jgi:hypothetical protein